MAIIRYLRKCDMDRYAVSIAPDRMDGRNRAGACHAVGAVTFSVIGDTVTQ